MEKVLEVIRECELNQGEMDTATVQSLVQQSPLAKPAQLHGGLCRVLDVFVRRLQGLGPALDVECIHFRKSGVQALCALQLALDKARSLLHYCADSSKLYLAIKGETMLSRFQEVKEGLELSLRRISILVPQELSAQILEIQVELSRTQFELDPSEKQIGADIISLLLQKQKGDRYENPQAEQETFSQVVIQLGLVSADSILVEKHALKRLLEKARHEGDSRKEAVTRHILQLMKKFNNILRMEKEVLQGVGEPARWPVSDWGWGLSGKLSIGEETDGLSSPSFPSHHCAERHCSELGSTPSVDNLAERDRCSSSPRTPRTSLPPEELRCPISLQLMSDPVIVASGQTYERVCIEKWLQEGHVTCPKTRQRLSHLNLTPNYCVKGLIASWCEAHGIGVPEPPSPPPSPVTSCRWEIKLTSELTKVRSGEQLKEARLAMEDDHLPAGDAENEADVKGSAEALDPSGQDLNCRVGAGYIRDSRNVCEARLAPAYGLVERGAGMTELNDEQWSKHLEGLVADLTDGSPHLRCQAAEEIRVLAKNNAKARAHIGDGGAIPALVDFLCATINTDDDGAQEVGALALLNVSINDDRNKAAVVGAGGVPLFVELLKPETSRASKEAAVAALLTLSCLNENKSCIGSSGAIPLLVQLLISGSNQARKDALITLYNLTIFLGNRPRVVRAGAIPILVHLLSLHKVDLVEKCVALLYNLSSIEEGRSTIAKTEGGVAVLAEILETGSSTKEKEHAVATLLLLCTNSMQHSQLVLREGVIPALVSLSVTGNPRGQDKAQKLLQHFREQRQKDTKLSHSAPLSTFATETLDLEEAMRNNGRKEEEEKGKKDGSRRIHKSRSGNTLASIWKSKATTLPVS